MATSFQIRSGNDSMTTELPRSTLLGISLARRTNPVATATLFGAGDDVEMEWITGPQVIVAADAILSEFASGVLRGGLDYFLLFEKNGEEPFRVYSGMQVPIKGVDTGISVGVDKCEMYQMIQGENGIRSKGTISDIRHLDALETDCGIVKICSRKSAKGLPQLLRKIRKFALAHRESTLKILIA